MHFTSTTKEKKLRLEVSSFKNKNRIQDNFVNIKFTRNPNQAKIFMPNIVMKTN